MEPEGDCWYCHRGPEVGPMDFSWEFDTYLHPACLQAEVNKNDPNDPETPFMAREFGLVPASAGA